MKKLGKGIATATAAGAAFSLGGCNAMGQQIGTCSPEHWGDNVSTSIQSGLAPGRRSDSYGYGELWEPAKPIFVEEIPESPTAGNKQLRVFIVNATIEGGEEQLDRLPETKFSAEVDLYNTETSKVENVLWGPETFDVSGGYEMVVLSAGESALKLTGEFDPASEGFFGIGRSGAFGDFTVTCIKNPS